MGPLPLTEEGNRFILNVVDHLTRYAVVVPLKTKKAEEVARAIRDHVMGHYGPPKIILSDNGREFRNAVVKKLAVGMGAKLKNITIYHPSSNGLVERSNAQIQMALRGIRETVPGDWDQHLRIAQLAVNSAYCRTLGDTPFFVVHRRDPTFPEAAWIEPEGSSFNPDMDAIATQRIYEYVQKRLKVAADAQ